jgi:hypothetical protein
MTPTNPPSRNASAGHGHDGSAHGPHHGPDDPTNPDVLHETSDVNVRVILASGAGMVVVAVIAAIAMYVLFRVLEAQAAANDPQLSPLAMPANQLPPAPRLQTNEPAGLRKFRLKEDETLLNYGWVDEKAGIAHIPIEQAKKKLLEQGLPSRSTPIDGRVGTHAPAMGMASSGRNIPVKKDN